MPPLSLNPPLSTVQPDLIALVGLPGSGKSTIGKQLARRLGFAFLDTDVVIERRQDCSVRELFERDGEQSFRDLEQEVIAELSQSHRSVLATGGGAILRQANRDHLHQRCSTIYLHSAPHQIFRRLRHDKNRPLLQVADPLAKLEELYAARDPFYRETAQVVIDTGFPSVSTLVNLIIAQLELAGTLR